MFTKASKITLNIIINCTGISSDVILNDEIVFIKTILNHTSYPKKIVERRHVRKKQNKNFKIKKNLVKGKTENKDEKLNLILSYLGNESISLTRRLTRIIRPTKINIGIIFKKTKLLVNN